jgi:hypothetical protein
MLYALLGGVFCSWVVSFTIINGNILPVMSLIALKPLFPSWHSKLLRSLAHAGRYLSCRQSVSRQAQTRLTILTHSFQRVTDLSGAEIFFPCHLDGFVILSFRMHALAHKSDRSLLLFHVSAVSDPINITHHHTFMHIDSRRHDQ